MIYREVGKTGIKLSRLGFGAMRFPMRNVNGANVIDYEKSIPLMHAAFDAGVNYIDSAPVYNDKQSEIAVGIALKGYRDKVYLSTKNPIENDSADDFMRRLEKSLAKLDTDYIDFYHLWGIGLQGFNHWQSLKDGPLQGAERAFKEGLIKHLSFSYHDDAKNFKPIVDSGLFKTVLIQYNLLDRSNEENIAYAKSKGLFTMVMGPVGGGCLGTHSDVIQGLLKNKSVSTAEMALRFVLANDNVDMALSGMSNLQQLEENVEIAKMTGHLNESEVTQVKAMMEEHKGLAELYCTRCDYCKPCPQDINIGMIFGIMNQHRVYGLTEAAKNEYNALINKWTWVKSEDASKCTECGACEAKCPQKLPIIKQLKETHEALKPGS
jgi:hypothetical protein